MILAIDSSGSMRRPTSRPTAWRPRASRGELLRGRPPGRLPGRASSRSRTRPTSSSRRPPTASEAVSGARATLQADNGTALGDAIARSVDLGADEPRRASTPRLEATPARRARSSPTERTRPATTSRSRRPRRPSTPRFPSTPSRSARTQGTIEGPDGYGETRTISVPPDPETLHAVAEKTGGKFFEAADADALAASTTRSARRWARARAARADRPLHRRRRRAAALGRRLSALWFAPHSMTTDERKEVIDMDRTRKLNPRAFLALMAMAFVVAAIWAATATAAGGSPSSSSDSSSGQPAAELVQEGDGTTPSAEDCPEGGGDSDSGSNDSDSTDFSAASCREPDAATRRLGLSREWLCSLHEPAHAPLASCARAWPPPSPLGEERLDIPVPLPAHREKSAFAEEPPCRCRTGNTARTRPSTCPTAPGRTSCSTARRSGARPTCATATRRSSSRWTRARKQRDVRPARPARLQGDRGRLPVGVEDRLRLRAQPDRGRPDPRRHDDRGADAGAAGADRAHVRGDRGARRAIVHLYNSTSTTQRRVVFRLDKAGITDLAVRGTMLCRKLAAQTSTEIVFQYSPESFHGTELDYALEICEAVIAAWEPTRRSR